MTGLTKLSNKFANDFSMSFCRTAVVQNRRYEVVVNSSKVPYDIKISKICIYVQRFPIKCLSRDNFPKVLRTEATHANLMKSYIVSFFYIWLPEF